MIWWEKTVEYKFILSAATDKKLDFAAPLSGVQEHCFADGIFSSNYKIILIEFKRSYQELKTEEDKFVCYEKAKKEMSGRDTHHYLVYGSEDVTGSLNLHARNYFSQKNVPSVLSVLDHGMNNEEFKMYLCDLIGFKKVDGRSDGTLGPESTASVLGISSESAKSVSLTEYVRIELPALYQDLTPTKKLNKDMSFGLG
ncbi:hypothetical protein [Teredinibacter sp. KSP-S5-2]|uniref:hypothetical protein n=1 Tax=Teredinibacter sp. KSP-S5-2 TaxID=3034506 RepID=UPI0029346595|nr:hypothetical protein [Teredinibacter sp. KSP-S5-2]WNO10489.1 hypothetical protein P5V12_04820 [Teredinibacter sp. KSP-S5-2]